MSEPSIQTELALVKQSVKHLGENLDFKHQQNRVSVHQLRDEIQDTNDAIEKTNENVEKCNSLITGIRIANARWNIIAGIITAVIVESIRAIASHIK